VGQPKSKAASAMAQQMNPAMQAISQSPFDIIRPRIYRILIVDGKSMQKS